MLYPSNNLSFIKILTFFFLAVSGIIQLLRVQTDRWQFVLWSQVTYLLGLLITVVYFMAVQNCDLAYPYLGGMIISSLTIWGIFLRRSAVENPLSS